jgi:deoxycytidine triphosphate deaminase
MILGIKKILRLVKKNKLVEGLCNRELNNPEGSGFDLRLGEVYKIEGKGFLGVENRSTPKSILIARNEPDKKEIDNHFIFQPNKYYLIKTIEKVNLPLNVSGIVFPRTTLFRSGISFLNGIVQPGYSGELSFGVINMSNEPLKISFGARVAHITFHKISGRGSHYRGQWQGGRVTTKGSEKQV